MTSEEQAQQLQKRLQSLTTAAKEMVKFQKALLGMIGEGQAYYCHLSTEIGKAQELLKRAQVQSPVVKDLEGQQKLPFQD